MAKSTNQTTKKSKTETEFPAVEQDDNDGIVLSPDDAATVRSAEASIMEQHRQLGMAREQYLVIEARTAQAIGEARQKYQAVLQTMAQKRGIDLKKESWTFNQQTMTFTKAPVVQ